MLNYKVVLSIIKITN